jgi:hypothetical protein
MSEKNRLQYRLQIPIKMETRDALEKLATASNSSLGAIAGSYLDELAPQFLQLAEAYELARSNPAAAVRKLGLLADAAMDALAEEQAEIIEKTQPKTKKRRA